MLYTVYGESSSEFIEKKSRFIGYIKGVSSKEDAEEFILTIKKKHPDASHNCSGYRVVASGVEHYKVDDDGEPGGTAGKPIGELIKLNNLINVVIVVSRYFGGIKLGAGGLVRNYAKGAKVAIESIEVVPNISRDRHILNFSYDKIDEVDKTLATLGVTPSEKEFLDTITYRLDLSSEEKSVVEGIRGIILI